MTRQILRAGLFRLVTLLGAVAMQAQTSFNFRAVHLIEGTDAIDVHFNELEGPSLTGVSFESVSELVENLPAVGGAFSIQYPAAGAGVGAAIIEGEQDDVESNREFVGVAHGTTANPLMTILERNRAQFPQPGKVLMRVLHAAADDVPIDVYIGAVGATPQIAGVGRGEVSMFVPITDEPTTLFLTPAGSKQPIATLSAPFGPANPFVTLIVTGTPSNLGVYTLNIGTPPDEVGSLVRLDNVSFTDVRVVNLRPGPGTQPGVKLDVYLAETSRNDRKVADTLDYRWVSRAFGPLVADTFRIKFVAPGESPANPVYELTRPFGNDSSYVVALTQFADRRPIGMVLKRTPIEPIPPGLGSTLVRFANATEEYGSLRAEISNGSATVMTDALPFLESSDFEAIPPGGTFSVKIFRDGIEAPIYDNVLAGGVNDVPSGAYLTIFAFGTSDTLSIDLLNESLPGRRQLGSFNPGGVGSVFSTSNALQSIGIRPNPTQDVALLSLAIERGGELSVSVVDVTGRIVWSDDNEQVGPGLHEQSLPTDQLLPGSYHCLVTIDGQPQGAVPIVVVR